MKFKSPFHTSGETNLRGKIGEIIDRLFSYLDELKWWVLTQGQDLDDLEPPKRLW